MAAVIVGLFLIGAALLIAAESIHQIRVPHELPAPFTLVVLAGVLAIKWTLSKYVGGIGSELESTAIKADAWHHLSDALTSGFAFIGISVALIGGEGWQSADDWAALFACAVIGANGVRLLGPALHEIMDTAPRGEIVDSVKAAARSVPGVIEIEKCFIRKMGLSFYVDLHVLVSGDISVREGHRIAHEVKRAIQQADARIADVLVHVEPAPSP